MKISARLPDCHPKACPVSSRHLSGCALLPKVHGLRSLLFPAGGRHLPATGADQWHPAEALRPSVGEERLCRLSVVSSTFAPTGDWQGNSSDLAAALP